MARLRETAALWNWQRTEIEPPHSTHRVIHLGTPDGAERVRVHLTGNEAGHERRECVVWSSDVWFPGALKTPRYLLPTLALNSSEEEILNGYGEKLRRVVRHQVQTLRVVNADTDDMVRMVNDSMLRPYAINRHGPGAAQLGEQVLRKIAKGSEGRVAVVFEGDQAVACHVGLASVRSGKRFWSAVRYGYPAEVFNDPKRLHRVNSANVHLAILSAKSEGFDYYNFGHCLGRPDDGLLHWKVRRGGRVDVVRPQEWMYVRPPSDGSAQFLWNTPLFADGGHRHGPVLHLGVPREKTPDDVMRRLQLTCPIGVSQVRLHFELAWSGDEMVKLAAAMPIPLSASS